MDAFRVWVGFGRSRKFVEVKASLPRVILLAGWDGPSSAFLGESAGGRLLVSVGDWGGLDGFGVEVTVTGPGNRVVRREALSFTRGSSGSASIPLELPPGEYVVEAVFKSPKVIAGNPVCILPRENTTSEVNQNILSKSYASCPTSQRIVISIREPELSVGAVGGSLEYLEGGSIRFTVRVTPSSHRLVKVLHGSIVRSCSVVREGDHYSVECTGSKLPEKVDLYSDGVLRGMEFQAVVSYNGRTWRIPFKLSAPVRLSPAYRESLEREAFELQRLLEEYPSNGSSLLGLIDRVKGFLEKHRVACVIDPSLECGVFEEWLSKLKAEAERVESLPKTILEKVSGNEFIEALNTYYQLVDGCKSGLFEGISSCKGEVLARVGRELAGKLAVRLGELFSEYRLDALDKLASAADRLCRMEIPGSGRSCGEIMKIWRRARDILGLLGEGILVELPEASPTQRIRGVIKVSYNGSSKVEGVKIDFTPASEYIDLEPSIVLKLPAIYPGMSFESDIIVRSHFRGRITIPYKKCYGEYCIEETTTIMVAVKRHLAGVFRPEKYLGKPIPSLKKYNPRPLKPTTLPAPLRLGEYVCTGLLGRGGFAVTLYCENTRTGARGVAKIPLEVYITAESLGVTGQESIPTRPEEVARVLGITPSDYGNIVRIFDREARILQELDHPNIIKAVEVGVEPFPYIIFNYCSYGDLQQSIISKLSKPLDTDTALKLMIPILHALQHGHNRPHPIYHLDVKPSNILIDERLIPLLSDYNIGKIMMTISRSSRTKGYTPGFAAPEQVNPIYGKPDHRADIFSHAATLYYLLTLHHPYPITEWDTTTGGFRNPNIKPTPPRKYNPNIPQELENTLTQALTIHPEDRIQKTTEYLNDLAYIHENQINNKP